MRTTPSRLSGLRRLATGARSSGQIVVMFAGATVLFILLCGVVVDLAYFWVGSLQAQRASDAAALAGAVYLPGDTSTACSTARAAATANGFTPTAQTGCLPPTGSTCTISGKVGICPVQDSTDPRQLDVTLSTSVGTFFSRVVGISSFPVTVHSKGVYVLPVPMGSPDAYYGVGNYSINQTSPPTNQTGLHGNSGAAAPSSNSTSGNVQQWSSFGLDASLAAGDTITSVDGIQVKLQNVKLSNTCAGSTMSVALSGNGGSSWTTPTTVAVTTSNQTFTFGATNSTAAWPGQTWNASAISDANFMLKVTFNKGCSKNRTLSVGAVSAQANYTYSRSTPGSTTMVTTPGVYDDSPNNTGTFLTSRGAWGAVITKGGDQTNGDAYSPMNSSLTTNTYHPDGYDYVVTLPAGGTVQVFDPGFCAMGGNGAGGNMGAGDHWIGGSGTPVSTYYTLWNTNGKPGLRSGWSEVFTSGSLFEGEKGFDPANTGPGVADGSGPGGATRGCDAYHDAWWTIPTGSLAAGTYAVQVQTTKTAHAGVAADSSQNQNTNAENMFALEAIGGADASGNTPQVYGNGKMVVYNNLLGGAPPPVQKFYLAQIDRATGAGKTALIDLWDIGDISGTGTLRILSPDGGSQNYVNFTYTTDSSCRSVAGAMTCYSSGTPSPLVSSIVTTLNGAQATNGTWIHISIPMPATYGESLWNNGWWQVEYTVTQGGNDTTTWQVSISGNPVHLLVP